MKRSLSIVTVAAVLFGTEQACAQWVEQFDSYNKSYLTRQSDWEEWDGSFGVDAYVVDMPTLTGTRAVQITGQPSGSMSGNDVVYDLSHLAAGQPTTGTWTVSTRVYVPSTANGTGWFIMLNEYPNQKSWSVQIQFDTAAGVVHPAEPAGTDQVLITDEWVDLITCIDLDNDRVDIFYGTDLVCNNASWTGGTDSLKIACIDLYGGEPGSGGIDDMYFDNMRIEKTYGPGAGLVTSPSPAIAGANFDIDVEAPQALGGRGMLYVYEVNGSFFVLRLFGYKVDGQGEFNFSGKLPAAVAGLQIGLKCFTLPAGGGAISESNLELMVCQ